MSRAAVTSGSGEYGMPSCLPPRYRLLDLVFALLGSVAFLGDLGVDVWTAVQYYRGGQPGLAFIHLGLYALSSCVLQLLSWGWYRGDWREWAAEGAVAWGDKAANGLPEVRSAAVCHHGSHTAAGSPGPCCVEEDKLPPQDNTESFLPANGELALQEAANQDASTTSPPMAEHKEQAHGLCGAAGQEEASEDPCFITRFYTSRIWLWPPGLTLLHLLQLGYPLRCLHSLEVGIAAYKSCESSPKFSQYQEYAYFLTHDISMMRLFETFMENTPQLILVLYIIIQQETILLFQYFTISFSFICISWAILDYHQSLRLFLKDKKKLNCFSSVIYFFWNFCLISSRVLCITLFTVTFHWMIALHFVGVSLVFFLWACLQKTEFMQSKYLEPFYRATVAVILYFSWFNIADGRTLYRCIVYHVFITADSLLLLFSWKYLKFPSTLDEYESLFLWSTFLLTGLGFLTKVIYYKCIHPNVTSTPKEHYDEIDGMEGYRMFAPTAKKQFWKQNDRMAHLAQQIY